MQIHINTFAIPVINRIGLYLIFNIMTTPLVNHSVQTLQKTAGILLPAEHSVQLPAANVATPPAAFMLAYEVLHGFNPTRMLLSLLTIIGN